MLINCGKKETVDIVIVGYTEHGPLQQTVRAVKDIAAKYGEKIKLTVMSMETEEGYNYMVKHNLDAHLNVMINGKYKYKLNGREVVFQWFEGQLWTKEDLDAVINNIINPENKKQQE